MSKLTYMAGLAAAPEPEPPTSAPAPKCSAFTGSPDGLKAVQNSVKSVMCLKASPRRVELKNGQLIFGIDYNAANNEEAVRTFLKNNI